MREYFKTNRQAKQAIIFGIVITLLYKVWKFYIRPESGINSELDYIKLELLSTVYRFFGAFACVYFCMKTYKDQTQPGEIYWRPTSIHLILLPICGFLVEFFLFKANFKWGKFILEFFINLTVGFWEEFAFRGVILAGLLKYMGFFKAAFISSLYFSLFHLDVTQDPVSLLFIFLYGVLACMFFYLGNSLILLSLSHFVWDLNIYGYGWVIDGPYKSMILDIIVVLVFIGVLWRKHRGEFK